MLVVLAATRVDAAPGGVVALQANETYGGTGPGSNNPLGREIPPTEQRRSPAARLPGRDRTITDDQRPAVSTT